VRITVRHTSGSTERPANGSGLGVHVRFFGQTDVVHLSSDFPYRTGGKAESSNTSYRYDGGADTTGETDRDADGDGRGVVPEVVQAVRQRRRHAATTAHRLTAVPPPGIMFCLMHATQGRFGTWPSICCFRGGIMS
jgi:hypothetical protein